MRTHSYNLSSAVHGSEVRLIPTPATPLVYRFRAGAEAGEGLNYIAFGSLRYLSPDPTPYP